MDHILCRKCDTGNPGYLNVCANCGADLFSDDNVPSGPPIGSEISDYKLRRNRTLALIASSFSTIFKVWLLYTMETSAHLKFMQPRDIFIILWPFLAAAAMAFRTRRWYLPLVLDSIIMAVVLIIVVGILIASQVMSR